MHADAGSSGRVVFTNLEAGRYTLRIVAKASNGERDIERRRIFIGTHIGNLSYKMTIA